MTRLHIILPCVYDLVLAGSDMPRPARDGTKDEGKLAEKATDADVTGIAGFCLIHFDAGLVIPEVFFFASTSSSLSNHQYDACLLTTADAFTLSYCRKHR